MGHPSVVNEVIRALSDRSPTVRGAAVECLSGLGAKEAIAPLISKLEDSDSEVRMMAASGLGDLLQGKSSPPELVRRLQDPNELVRIEAAESLGVIGDKKALPDLWKALTDSSSLVRSYVAGAIGELGSRKDIARLEEHLRDENSDTSRVGYYQALYKLGKRDALDQLLRMLSHSNDYRVRCAVAKILCDSVDDKNSALNIYTALREALRLEPTTAAKSSIRSSIREIKQRFLKGNIRRGPVIISDAVSLMKVSIGFNRTVCRFSNRAARQRLKNGIICDEELSQGTVVQRADATSVYQYHAAG